MQNNENEIEKNEKVCNKCHEKKLAIHFHKHKKSKDGLNWFCKICIKNINHIQSARYYSLNKEKVGEYHKIYHDKNKEKLKKYKQSRQHIRNANDRNRRKIDPIFKLSEMMRGHINRYLKEGKSKRTRDIVGCSWEELKIYIEKQWTKGMSWENHSLEGWHIDHKIPLSSAKTEEEIYKLNHYTNLQPLWSIDNLRKGKNIC